MRRCACGAGRAAGISSRLVCGGPFPDASRWVFPLTHMRCVCVCVSVYLCVCCARVRGTQRPKRKESWPRIAVGVLIIVCCVTILIFRALRHKLFVALGCVKLANQRPLARFASVPGPHAGGPATPRGQIGEEDIGHPLCGQAACQQACS